MFTDYADNFCTFSYMGEINIDKVWYADISGLAFPMPTRWAKKIVDLLRDNQIEKACHYIDMAKSLLEPK